MVSLPFQDRAEAGRLLGAELATRQLGARTIVLALPRGGLPVAAEVAEALRAPLDVVVARKLGVPWRSELAMGAIAGGARVLNHRLIRDLHVSGEEVEAVVALEVNEMDRREKLYRGGLPEPDLAGRVVVLVDDGLATGSTMMAAARHVRNARPRKLIVAVPVASCEAYGRVRREADECVYLARPNPFFAVGEWYLDFRQVTDDEAREILERSHKHAPLIW